MIPVWITLYIFCCLTLVTRSSTYLILALSAAVNIVVDQYTADDSPWLMQVYSSIEFFTCLAVLAYGERHRIYQAVLLTMMAFAHFMMELWLIDNTVPLITPEIYVYTISVLIIAQWIGAGRGLDTIGNLPWPDLNIGEAFNSDLSHHNPNRKIQKAEK